MSKRPAEETELEASKRQATEVVLLDTPDAVLLILLPYIERAREVCRRWRDNLQGWFLDSLRLNRDHYLRLGLSAMRNGPDKEEIYFDFLDKGIAYAVTAHDLGPSPSTDVAEAVLTAMQNNWWPFTTSKAPAFPLLRVNMFFAKDFVDYGVTWSILSVPPAVNGLRPGSFSLFLRRLTRLPLTWHRVESMIENGVARGYLFVGKDCDLLMAAHTLPFNTIDSLIERYHRLGPPPLRGGPSRGKLENFYPAYLEEVLRRGWSLSWLVQATKFRADSRSAWEAILWILGKRTKDWNDQRGAFNKILNEFIGIRSDLRLRVSPDRLTLAENLFEEFFGRDLERINDRQRYSLIAESRVMKVYPRPVLRYVCRRCVTTSERIALLDSVDHDAETTRVLLEEVGAARGSLALAYVMSTIPQIFSRARARTLLDACPELETSDEWGPVERYLESLTNSVKPAAREPQ